MLCRVFAFYFSPVYTYTIYNSQHISDMRSKSGERKEKRERRSSRKGQNTHYIMHTQYLARKNH